MNLLDLIHDHLADCGPMTASDVHTAIDPERISRMAITQDLHRLLKAGRVTHAKSGVWSAVTD